jgi:RNA polymerase sigma factor (sigma-70 family)
VWNERRLARRAARGDPDAFAAIFRRYQQDLYRYCVAILGDPQDAQDALQNTMVKALAALPGERRQIELKPWLYRVAHNESIELRRGRTSEPLADDAPAPGLSLEQQAADRRRLRDLLADIGELPERQRGVLVMRELAGLDFEQIGAALDSSPVAARQVLYEARRGLQQMSEGREMHCEAVTTILSEGDGRVTRRRDIRAHLRDCPECRAFADAIDSRRETLAAISPLPAVAAAAIAKGALSGTAGGGASTGSAGVAGGAAAKAASTGAILKSAAGIVVVAAVGAVAVDHGHLFHGSAAPAAGAHGQATVAAGSSSGSDQVGESTGGAAHSEGAVAVAGRSARARPLDLRAHSVNSNRTANQDHGAHSETPAVPNSGLLTEDPGGNGGARSNVGVPGGGASGRLHGKGASRARAHPDHPSHPAHPQNQGAHPGHPTRPVYRPHPEHPSHPEHPASTANPSQPEKPAHPVHAEQPSSPATGAAEPAPKEAAKAAEEVEDAAETAPTAATEAPGADPGNGHK